MPARSLLLVALIFARDAQAGNRNSPRERYADVQGTETYHNVVPLHEFARLLLASSRALRSPKIWTGTKPLSINQQVGKREGAFRISRKNAFNLGVLATLFSPSYAYAKFGEFANIGAGDVDSIERSSIGTGENNVDLRFANVDVDPLATASIEKWRAMVAEVKKAMQSSPPSYPLATSAIYSAMQTLKPDMRRVGKVLQGGVIEKKFDYVSGQYALPPLNTQAENIFKEVNLAYTYADAYKKEDPQKCLASIDKADALFSQWVSMFEELKSQA